MGTKNNPGAFDCYTNAEPDEPMFILLARDHMAPALVDAWADKREQAGEHPAKVAEARECADNMRKWRTSERPPKTEISIICDQCGRTVSVDPANDEGHGVECPVCGFNTRY